MSENITILLTDSTTQEEKINAANNIITNYNLQLTTEEIMSVFSRARFELSFKYYAYYFVHYEFLLKFLLNQNIGMFIAMSKYCNDNKPKTFWILSICIGSCEPFYVDSSHLYSHHVVVSTYKNLLDHNNFSIDNLKILNECREKIEEYRSEKYGGRLTKAAKK